MADSPLADRINAEAAKATNLLQRLQERSTTEFLDRAVSYLRNRYPKGFSSDGTFSSNTKNLELDDIIAMQNSLSFLSALYEFESVLSRNSDQGFGQKVASYIQQKDASAFDSESLSFDLKERHTALLEEVLKELAQAEEMRNMEVSETFATVTGEEGQSQNETNVVQTILSNLSIEEDSRAEIGEKLVLEIKKAIGLVPEISKQDEYLRLRKLLLLSKSSAVANAIYNFVDPAFGLEVTPAQKLAELWHFCSAVSCELSDAYKTNVIADIQTQYGSNVLYKSYSVEQICAIIARLSEKYCEQNVSVK